MGKVRTIYVDGVPVARLLEDDGVKLLSLDVFIESRKCLELTAERILEVGPHRIRIVKLEDLELVVHELKGRGQVVSVRKRVEDEGEVEELVRALLKAVEDLCSDRDD